ncbi:hypothetical protein BV25DRAFT_1909714 [Artomyces pyxidatus]|uniref:Uncharacterized protein n=1 Tax=Artomyces pyxidatus TaxID=48021 RepID=A0ACB8SLJ8_9AGAM|nr:hypothetical protein BV25DRAFT_1909714 [Artomyces pyxidatus]
MDGTRDYDLSVRQQPKQARMCGVGADRRPIDPPPIVQLRVIDKSRRNLPSPSPSPPPHAHHQPSHSHSNSDSSPLDAIYSENDNRDAGFFVFPDLSVRQEGSYRLKLSLFEVVG